MAQYWWRLFMVAVAGSLFVMTGGVSGQPGAGGYGSYDNYNQGLSYNIIPEQPLVKKVVDFYARPKYSFGYEVEDYYNQLSHGRWEIRDGDVTQGQYRVLLPDGRIQIVSYVADKAGYRPHIQYIGKGVHPPPAPAYAHVKIPQQLVEIEAHPHHHPQLHSGPAAYGSAPAAYGSAPSYVPAGPVPVQAVVPYGPEQGHQYGGDYAYEPILSPSRISKKRALLYDRTLFRRDIPKPLKSSRESRSSSKSSPRE